MSPRSTRPSRSARARIGVDTGGTFTDLVHLEGDEVQTGKLASTPDDPSRAVLEGLSQFPNAGPAADVVHGSTVALNAVLTGRTARVALVTNEGFRDLIEIGRQDRPDIYAIHPIKPEPLVSRLRRFEIPERTWPGLNGEVEEVQVASPAELAEVAERIAKSQAESLAVCLLHSYADPSAEERVAAALSSLGLPITCSAGILPVFRESERFSTAVVNAALIPVMQDYLRGLERSIGDARLFVMQNSGGTLAAARAAVEPVRVLFSGPAGGVVGAGRAAAEAGFPEIVTLDMGGTSTDIAFHADGAGLLNAVTDARVAGHPIAVPSLDVHTIGCGGGSLVRVDSGGVLHVGPESAGADPGPVAYGRGEVPTVTDAHVFLGHIDCGDADEEAGGNGFLGGALELDHDAVALAFERLGKQLRIPAPEAASAVLEVARSAMRRALGVMTMQRGRDPRGLPLVAFGGAGGLSACALAASLGMEGAIVPAHPGVLSAHGMATADAVSDHARTILGPLAEWNGAARKRAFTALAKAGTRELRSAGYAANQVTHEFVLEARYAGQSYGLTLPESADPARAFGRLHATRYGWTLDDREIELVTLTARAIARTKRRRPKEGKRRAAPKRAVIGERVATFGKRRLKTPIIDRTALAPGHTLRGPAIIEEYSGTTLVPPAWRLETTRGGHLWLAPE